MSNGPATTPDRLLTVHEVAARYGGINIKTVGRHAKAGRIPKPVKATFGKGDLWRESEISAHLKSLESQE